jgi:hypothetical protein
MREVIYGLPEFPFDENKYVVGGCTAVGPEWRCLKCSPVGNEFDE